MVSGVVFLDIVSRVKTSANPFTWVLLKLSYSIRRKPVEVEWRLFISLRQCKCTQPCPFNIFLLEKVEFHCPTHLSCLIWLAWRIEVKATYINFLTTKQINKQVSKWVLLKDFEFQNVWKVVVIIRDTYWYGNWNVMVFINGLHQIFILQTLIKM